MWSRYKTETAPSCSNSSINRASFCMASFPMSQNPSCADGYLGTNCCSMTFGHAGTRHLGSEYGQLLRCLVHMQLYFHLLHAAYCGVWWCHRCSAVWTRARVCIGAKFSKLEHDILVQKNETAIIGSKMSFWVLNATIKWEPKFSCLVRAVKYMCSIVRVLGVYHKKKNHWAFFCFFKRFLMGSTSLYLTSTQLW